MTAPDWQPPPGRVEGHGMDQQNEPIKRRKLSDEVQSRLLALISVGRLEPGAALPSERELMSEYQVGRPAIREAMQNLQRMGLVEIKHGERPRVGQPNLEALIEPMALGMHHVLTHSASTMEHLKEARVVFECQMVAIAAAQARPADLERLEAVLGRQEGQRADPAVFLALDGQFHVEIAAISGNPIFLAVSRAIFDWLARFHVDMVRKRGAEHLTLSEHRTILETIRAGDVAAAQAAMRDHLLRANALYRQDSIG